MTGLLQVASVPPRCGSFGFSLLNAQHALVVPAQIVDMHKPRCCSAVLLFQMPIPDVEVDIAEEKGQSLMNKPQSCLRSSAFRDPSKPTRARICPTQHDDLESSIGAPDLRTMDAVYGRE